MNKSLNIDMATMINSLSTFEGREGEDVVAWLDELLFVSSYLCFTDEEKIKICLLKTNSKARQWMIMLLKKNPTISIEELRNALKERFLYEASTMRITKEILDTKPTKSVKEFTELLEKANQAHKWSCIEDKYLVEIVTLRAPIELKSLAFKGNEKINWEEYYMEANSVKWLIKDSDTKTEKTELKEIKRLEVVARKDTPKEKSREHYQIRKNLRENKLGQRRQIASLGYPKKNPFYKEIIIGGKKHEGLMDTGADASIVNRKNLPSDTNTIKSSVCLRAANGQRLDIEEQAIGVEAVIDKRKIKFDPFITESHPEYTIVGAETLKNYPELLNTTLSKSNNLGLKRVNNVNLEEEIISNFKDIFKTEIDQMTLCSAAKHKIKTTTDSPIFNKSQRIPVHYESIVDEEMNKLLKLGIIRASSSPWCSRIVPVPKKDGTVRMCIDYRPLNQITIKDAYPIPRIDEILDSLNKAKIFSTLDATKGYYQLQMEPDDIQKTAFGWKGGLYEFTRLPFGLCNAPATFQRAMDSVFKKEAWKFVIPYLDDIIIFSESEELHKEHLKVVLGKLKAAGIALNKAKCKFFRKEIKILGNIVTEGKVMPDPEKIKAIQNYEKPRTIDELRSFLGLVNYIQEFLPNQAQIIADLSNLLKGENKRSKRQIIWSENLIKAFNNIKKAIVQVTYRKQPDFTKEFILTTDASNIAIGAILSQVNSNGKEEMISAYSHKLDSTQQNYSITDKELLAVMKGVEHYRHYLIGKEFLLRTDHKSIEYLWSTQNTNSRLLRWALKLQEYKFKLQYIKGEENIADGLSRPIPAKAELAINNLQLQYSGDEIQKILLEYHIKSGHGSKECMKFLISKRYKWPEMYKDIDRFTGECEICLKEGRHNISTKNRTIVTTKPNEMWEVDMIGRIPDNDGTNKFIFIAIDHYSKWVETKVMKNKESEFICQAINELIIEKHGIPEKILSDNGLEFVNLKVKNLATKNGIDWVLNSPEHHQTVGAVERANQTLMCKLRKLTNFGEKSWERALPSATFAMNISFNRAIRTSPYILKYGKAPMIEIDKTLNQSEVIIPISESINVRDQNFEDYARKNIEKGKIKLNKELNENEKVLIYKKPLCGKFNSNWKTGFRIVRKIEPDAYIVTDGKNQYRLNKSHIKLDTSKRGKGMSPKAL